MARPASTPASTADSGVFTDTAHQLSKLLDEHLWHGQQGGNAWKECFCALALTLNPDCRVTEAMEALPPQMGDMDDIAVLNALAHMGNYPRDVKGCAAEADGRLLPCLFSPDAAHLAPLVVLARNDDHLVIYDAERRQTRPAPLQSTLGRTPGTLWFFQPFDANRQALSKFVRAGTGQSWFRALLSRFSTTFAHIFAAGLILNIVALAPPLYMMAVYDKVISPSDMASLPAITAGVVIALLAEYALRRTRSRALSWLSARLDNLVGNRIFSHLLGLSPEVVEKASVAAQIARIKTFESIRDLFSGSIFLSFLELPYIALAAVIIAVIAGPLVMVPLLMIAGFGLLFLYVHRRVRAVIRLAAKSSSARQQFTLETFEKLTGIHANGLAGIWARKYDDLSSREIVMNFQLSWLGVVAETCAQALTLLAAVATVGYGAHLVWAGAISTGALIASMMLVWRILTPFYSLCAMVARLEQLKNSIIQVNDLMELETEEETAHTFARLSDIKGNITLANVTMHYGSESDHVFHNIHLNIAAGDVLGVTGRNGAGKSTLLKLVKGLYRPQAGAVRIDGFDIRQLDPHHLRRHISYVAQRAEFFSGTVIENLRFARPLASEDDVIQSLILADAWKDIQDLPEGLHSHITPQRVSASLAARLSLARAYLHNAPILLIDELPASLLHDRAGRYLRQYIEKAKGRRTVIFVSQDDSFLALAGTVLELSKGAPPRLIRKDDAIQETLQLQETA